MFERPTGGEQALLVHIDFSCMPCIDELHEFKQLAASANIEAIDLICFNRKAPTPKYLIGLGQAEHIQALVKTHAIPLVIINHPLSPAQERNLERLWQCRVIDRIGLILDIFAQRARTHEGKLQVELAQLAHLSTRLVRGWTHLERQKGGIGLRGPGETQLETDRRLLGKRITTIQKRLEKVRSARQQSRRKRQRQLIPTVSLVGYTNAGKSTLFNRLTDSGIFAADQLFATLDPTMRQINLGKYGEVVLADTVGFIRDLPHELVESFKATLEETREADLLLHVVDAHDPAHISHSEQVDLVLTEIGAEQVAQLIVYNKIDLMDETPRIERNQQGQIKAVWVSAEKSLGMDLLLQAIYERLSEQFVYKTIELTPAQAHVRAKLYQRNVVHEERIDEHGNFLLVVALPAWEFQQLIGTLKICRSD